MNKLDTETVFFPIWRNRAAYLFPIVPTQATVFQCSRAAGMGRASQARTLTQLAGRVAVRLDPSRATLEPNGLALITKMGAAYRDNLRHALAVLGPISDSEWQPDPILDAMKRGAEAGGLKLGDAMQPIRVALTGDTVSEPVNELLAVVGKKAALARLERSWRRPNREGLPSGHSALIGRRND